MFHRMGFVAGCALLLITSTTFAQELADNAEPPAAPEVAADQVHLEDGSRIVGRLTGWTDGSVTIATRAFGDVNLTTAEVRGISTGAPMQVQLATGERVIGRLLYDETDDTQRILDTNFGDIDAATDQFASVWRADEPEPAVAQLQQAEQNHQQQTEQVRQQHEEQLLSVRQDYQQQIEELETSQAALGNNWSARLELGTSGSTGNVESFGINGRASATRRTDYDRLFLHVGGRYERSDGRDIAEQVFGGASLEVDITDRLFTYISAQLERDEFEELELRTVVTGGLGYFVFQEDDHELKVRAGAGFQHETYRDATESDVVLELGVDYRVDINDWLRFTHSTTLFPSVEDLFDDYRLVSETAGEIPIGTGDAWRLRAGMRNKYNAMPRPGVQRLDTAYFLNFVYDFN